MLVRRLFVVVGALVLLLMLSCGGLAAIIIFTGPRYLNPLESIVLRLTLTVRQGDLEKRMSADTKAVCFPIQTGDNATSVATRLASQGFVLDSNLFKDYLRYQGIDQKLQAATYFLRKNTTMRELAEALTKPTANNTNILIVEGWRIEQIADRIDNTPGLAFTGQDFEKIVGAGVVQPTYVHDFVQKTGIPAGRSLEGFLFPATYTLPACASADQLVQRILTAFDTNVPDTLRTQAKTKGMSLYQVIILASIVEREAVVEEDRPLIASVYLNRYLNSIKPQPDVNIPRTLDADPTIQYALGNTRDLSTWWPPLTQQDYHAVSSPYNTYINVGLPPGPISNPRLSSITAVISPATTDYLYFRACPGEGGKHRFATSFAEQQNACSG